MIRWAFLETSQPVVWENAEDGKVRSRDPRWGTSIILCSEDGAELAKGSYREGNFISIQEKFVENEWKQTRIDSKKQDNRNVWIMFQKV